MANVLSALAPTLFSTARVVPKELTAFLGAARSDFDHRGVAQGGTVKVQTVPRLTVGSVPAPSMAFSAGSDRTPSTIDFTLNQTAQVSWNLTAEEERVLMTGGNAVETLKQTVEQGWRSLRNQIETHLGVVAKNAASRAVGTAGTTPFASDTSLLIDARKILIDNGSQSKRTAVLNSAAEANLLKLSVLQKVSEAGSSSNIREGIVGRLHGIDIGVSAGVASHTKGTGTGYLVNSAALAVGSTTIPVDTGSGTIVAGDVLAFAGDSNKYVVKTALTGGNVVIQEPGLLTAVADNSAVTVENNSTDNIVLGESGLCAVVRPALQPDGNIAEQMVVTDADTKISALFLRVVGDGMTSWYMRQVYDAFAPNPYEIVKLRG
jgi:hypothetical protein